MRDNPLTSEILIETLKRSSLKTVLVEGTDDFEVYRKVERKIGVRNIDFLPCGGKNTLLKVFEKKADLGSSKIMFIADKDSWLFSKVPEDYKEIYFTRGYCIENDLFEDGSDFILALLEQDELSRFKEIVANVSKWFAFEVQCTNGHPESNRFSEITLLSTKVIPNNSNNLSSSFLKSRKFVEPSKDFSDDIIRNYKLKLRGKFIFQILEKLFQDRKEKKAIKYHRRQLFDMCFVEGTRVDDRKSNINTLICEIQKFTQ